MGDRPRYLPALDGLRALAVAAVFVSHAWASVAPGGWLGVDLFFVLSGYLITSLLTAEWISTGRIRLRRFYWRRALRLLPALAATIILSLPIAFDEWPALAADTAREAVGAALYCANWLVVAGVVKSGLLVHTWTLSVEEQFYWLWPLALLAALRYGGRVAAAILAMTGACASIADHALVTGAGYFRTDVRADSLLLGCAAALAGSLGLLRRMPQRGWSVVGALSGLALIVGAAAVTDGGTGTSLTWIDCASLGLVVAAAQLSGGLLAKFLESRVLVWLGQRSYGIYLYALPVTALIQPATGADGWDLLVMGGAMTIALAALSYQYLETPFLRMKHRVAPSEALPVALPMNHG